MRLPCFLPITLLAATLATVPPPAQAAGDESGSWLASPPILRVTRYVGHGDYASSESMRWRRGATGAFEEIPSHETHASNDSCRQVLALQEYPLKRMMRREYLDPEEVESYSRLALKLHPNQVTFFQMTREIPESHWHSAWPEELRKLPHERIDRADTGSGAIEVKTAAMWSISGQSWDPRRGEIVRHKLPWQLEDSLADASAQLDRGRYPFVWEWGRMAQDVNGETEALRAVSAMAAYQELRALGGSLDDAWVTFHSLARGHTRAYEAHHPGRRFAPEHAPDTNAIFLVPLRDMLAQYPPRLYSAKVARLVELSGGRLSDLEALDLLSDFKLQRWRELELRFPGTPAQPGPVILNDVSDTRWHRCFAMLRGRYGLPEEAAYAVHRYLATEVYATFHTWNEGQYFDLTDAQITYAHYRERNAVEISNLSPEAARRDPDYVKKALFSAYYYLMRMMLEDQVFPHPDPYHSIARAVGVIRGEGIHFGISTWDPEISRQARSLGPTESISYGLPDPSAGPAPDLLQGNDLIWQIHARPIEMHFFDIERIQPLIRARYDLSEQSEYALEPGRWEPRYLSSMIDLF